MSLLGLLMTIPERANTNCSVKQTGRESFYGNTQSSLPAASFSEPPQIRSSLAKWLFVEGGEREARDGYVRKARSPVRSGQDQECARRPRVAEPVRGSAVAVLKNAWHLTRIHQGSVRTRAPSIHLLRLRTVLRSAAYRSQALFLTARGCRSSVPTSFRRVCAVS